jgi:hypothetical protein
MIAKVFIILVLIFKLNCPSLQKENLKKNQINMDPCIALCYYYILTKKNPVYKKKTGTRTHQQEILGK